MPPKQSAHGELDALQQRVADARLAVDAAEAAHIEAEAALEVAHDKVREAHELDQDPRAPTKALEKAKHTLEQAELAREGIEQRLLRAEREVAHFRETRGWDLLRERESVARELAGKLTRAVHEVVRLNQAITAERVYLDQLIAAIPGLSPRDDGPPSEHPWEETLKQLTTERGPNAGAAAAAPPPGRCGCAGAGGADQEEAAAGARTG